MLRSSRAQSGRNRGMNLGSSIYVLTLILGRIEGGIGYNLGPWEQHALAKRGHTAPSEKSIPILGSKGLQ